MKIAFVVHDFTRSLGHGRYTVELASRFRHDHEVHVFANTVDIDSARGLTVHHVPAVRGNALTTVLTFLAPATLAVGRDWDIVHAQGASCLRFNVVTAHICNAGWAQAQRDAHLARTWKQRVFERVITPVERGVFTRSPSAEVIAISHQLRGELAHYYSRRARVDVIHHGVDTSTFSPSVRDRHRAGMRAALGLHADQFTALFVGDLRKGGVVAIDAVQRVPSSRLVMVSRSDPAPYMAHARAIGIADRVLFRPGTDHIEHYYAAADAFLFPSTYDAFGMVVSEAMAMGLPVITSRQAGASELISHGVSGFVVDATDTARIAEHLATLAMSETARRTTGLAAREAVALLTWDAVARRTMEVYQRAVPMRGSGR